MRRPKRRKRHRTPSNSSSSGSAAVSARSPVRKELPSPTSPSGRVSAEERIEEPAATENQDLTGTAEVREGEEPEHQATSVPDEGPTPLEPPARFTTRIQNLITPKPTPSSIPGQFCGPLPFRDEEWNRQAVKQGLRLGCQLAHQIGFSAANIFQTLKGKALRNFHHKA